MQQHAIHTNVRGPGCAHGQRAFGSYRADMQGQHIRCGMLGSVPCMLGRLKSPFVVPLFFRLFFSIPNESLLCSVLCDLSSACVGACVSGVWVSRGDPLSQLGYFCMSSLAHVPLRCGSVHSGLALSPRTQQHLSRTLNTCETCGGRARALRVVACARSSHVSRI